MSCAGEPTAAEPPRKVEEVVVRGEEGVVAAKEGVGVGAREEGARVAGEEVERGPAGLKHLLPVPAAPAAAG